MESSPNNDLRNKRVTIDFGSFRVIVEGEVDTPAERPTQSVTNESPASDDPTRLPIHDPYVQRFWRAFLGMPAFSLWELLASFTNPKTGKSTVPSVALLGDLIGTGGGRHAILGRESAAGRAPQKGALTMLEEEGLVVVHKSGSGVSLKYSFDVAIDAPILTPEETRVLSKRARRYHRSYLRKRFGEELASRYDVPSRLGQSRNKLHPSLRDAILERDSYRCRFCGGPAKTVDHVVPVIQGGTDDPSNLVAACRDCNSRKNGRTPDEAGMAIMEPPS